MAIYRVKTEGSLIDYLTGAGYSRTKVKQLLKHRAVKVNGRCAKEPEHPLHEGDRIEIGKYTRELDASPALGIKIIYEDDALIVIEKPAGLLTIASETEKTKTAYYQLNEFLKQRSRDADERVFIVHRLDRDTSGLIVFAKNEQVKRALQDGWKDVDKRYYAVVEGMPGKKEGEIESRLSETKSLMVYSDRNSEEARIARTKYRVLKHGREYALLDVVLVTGRKNQIRVHLADIGHPVAGDKKYRARTNPLGRLGLHAYLLSFNHPVTGKRMRFKSNMPGSSGCWLKT